MDKWNNLVAPSLVPPGAWHAHAIQDLRFKIQETWEPIAQTGDEPGPGNLRRVRPGNDPMTRWANEIIRVPPRWSPDTPPNRISAGFQVEMRRFTSKAERSERQAKPAASDEPACRQAAHFEPLRRPDVVTGKGLCALARGPWLYTADGPGTSSSCAARMQVTRRISELFPRFCCPRRRAGP